MRQLQNYLKSLVREKDQIFRSWVGRLEALSPLAILERGYSLTFDGKGELIKEAAKVKIGEIVRTQLHRGLIYAKVEEIKTKEDEKQ